MPTKKSLETVRRVNFESFQKAKGQQARATDFDTLRQFEDSLINRGYPEATRAAFLATAYNEMGKAGAASKGIGGNGILGLNEYRMPITLLGNTPKVRGKQIHHILEDVTHVYTGKHKQAGNWNDGGSGGPKIMNGQDGSDQFWSSNDPYNATVILNKSYIRPKLKSDWHLRGNDARMMMKHMK